ncbi:MAG: hypothetical protein SFW09_06210 [Hyphomicrobiaceae bacterium]|nr:hypothetical protein [Hyphomicrobiaceae bacterium]
MSFWSRCLAQFLRHLMQLTWFWLSRTAYAVHYAPITLAAAISAALWLIPQLQELYLTHLEVLLGYKEPIGWQWQQILFAALSMGLLSASLAAVNAFLGRTEEEIVFRDHHDASVDPLLANRVAIAGLLAAALPWIGLVAGMREAVRQRSEQLQRLLYSETHFGTDSGFNRLPVDVENMRLVSERLEAFGLLLNKLPSAGWLALWTFAFALLIRSALRIRILRRAVLEAGQHFRPGWWIGRLTAALMICFTFGNLFIPPLVEWSEAWRLARLDKGDQSFVFGRLWPGWNTIHGWFGNIAGDAAAFWELTVACLSLVAVFVFWRKRQLERQGPIGSPLRAIIKINYLVVGLSLCLAIVSGFREFAWVDIARSFGPLAMALLLCVVLVTLVGALAAFLQRTRLPFLLGLAMVLAVIVANKLESSDLLVVLSVGLAALSLGFLLARQLAPFGFTACLMLISLTSVYSCTYGTGCPGGKTAAASSGDELTRISRGAARSPTAPVALHFSDWLKRREPGWRDYLAARGLSPDRPFPVFIIAAEGGGIYAASAAAAFLARLQERCPSFAQHVFAISGVSGGAVGAAVFNAVLAEPTAPPLAAEGCIDEDDATTTPQASSTFQRVVSKIFSQDHLSPIVGLLVPDILGTTADRAWGLEFSIADALGLGSPARSVRWRNQSYAQHWTPESRGPALVLNTTWVNVGKRVAFSPFGLASEKFATLETFAELAQRKDGGSGLAKRQLVEEVASVGLLQAAVASARFPGVLKALELKNVQNRRWSFVDGGYVDASGALTAQEIYRSLLDAVEENRAASRKAGSEPWSVDLRVVILTTVQSSDVEEGVLGPQLNDLLAPIQTLFSVRGLLSRIAVRETITNVTLAAEEFRRRQSPMVAGGSRAGLLGDTTDSITKLAGRAQRGDPDDWDVTTVELNQDDVRLPLGWKLSGLTYDLISLQLGQADLCASAKPDAMEPRHTGKAEERKPVVEVGKTIRANSCVMAAIEKQLTGIGDIASGHRRQEASQPVRP